MRSAREIAEAIRNLSKADWARLKMLARSHARVEISAEDLLQEAFTRALEGRRHCPVDVDIVKFLDGAMRSISDGEQQKFANRSVQVQIDEESNATDSSENLEDLFVSSEQYANVYEEISSLFEDDSAAKDIVEGIIEGFTAEELRELTGLDKKAYDTKRKLMRRRIVKKYPGGWKP